MTAPRLLRLLVAVVLVTAVVIVSDWRAVWNVLRQVQPAWVAVAIGFAALDRVIINYRYEILLLARDIRVGFWKLFRIQLAANFLGSFLPSSLGVDAVRIAALCRAGHPTGAVVAATLVDRFSLALLSLLFGSVMLLALAGTRVPPHILQFVLLTTAIGVAMIAAALHPAVRRWIRGRLLPRVPERLRHTASTIAEAALAYRHDVAPLIGVVATTLVLFLVRIAFAKALALACGVDVAFIDLLLVIPVLWIVVMLPITIGAIGVQDAGYVVLMALIGVGPSVAFSMSILEHAIARLVSLPGAALLGDITERPPAPAEGA